LWILRLFLVYNLKQQKIGGGKDLLAETDVLVVLAKVFFTVSCWVPQKLLPEQP